MIGLGDRALEGKACAPWGWRTTALTPRVIALQNRMRLTQSPRRARYHEGFYAGCLAVPHSLLYQSTCMPSTTPVAPTPQVNLAQPL